LDLVNTTGEFLGGGKGETKLRHRGVGQRSLFGR
jgi:hypothetical protein